MATKAITPDNMRLLSQKLIDHFVKENCWFQMIVYVDNEAWYSEQMPDTEKHITKKGNEYFVKKDMDVQQYLEYNNPKTISIVFEGPLYSIINYHDYDYLTKLTNKYLTDYGLYFEQGYAWSATAYE